MKKLILYFRLTMMMGIIAIAVIPVQAISQDSLKTAITNRFKLTTRSSNRRIQEPGTVLVIQKEGLRADLPKIIKVASVIKNGNLVSVGGGRVFFEGNTGHSLKVGERLYLYGVSAGKNFVNLFIVTVETFDVVKEGTTQSQPYELSVMFQYEDGIVGLSAEQILNDIYVWFKPQEEKITSSTKTISLGMLSEQVIELLGIPEKKIELGSKKILVYKDIKITLVDNKVVDVQ